MQQGRSISVWFKRLYDALPIGGGFESTPYLTKWLMLSLAIGIVAGLGAMLFFVSIQWATAFFLGTIVGYIPPAPVGEGAPILRPMARPWLLPVVTTVGGLLSGLIVYGLAPEAEGHGTDAAIEAIHQKRGYIRSRIPPIKLIASAITIGSGGSGGREGPTAQISAGFASFLTSRLNLTAQDRRIAVAVGIGSGIGAIFRAPLGGAVLAAEIQYMHDLEVEAIIPALIASIVGYTIFGAYFGFTPIFGAQPALALDSPLQLVYYALLGVLCGIFGILYARSFYGVVDIFHRFSVPNWIKPALGGLLVGSIGLVLPGALYMGYGWVQIALSREVLGLPLWVLLLLPFAKILTTSLSIGSGGSGGVFAPGMVIGAMIGASFWRLAYGTLPQIPSEPAPFVIIGMMATFGGVAHAPLAVMLMVAEMTGNLSLLAPAMIAVAIASAMVGNNTIYRSQLPNRASSPAHRIHFSFPLLSSLWVRDAMGGPPAVISSDSPVSAAEALLSEDETPGLAVIDSRREIVGVVTMEQVERVSSSERDLVPVQAIVRTVPKVGPNQSLDTVLEQLAEHEASWAPVVEQGRIVGHIDVREIVSAYRASMQQSVRRVSEMPPGTSLIEIRLGPTSPLTGKTVNEASLPRNSLVVSIDREGEVIFPRPNTRLEEGDSITVIVDPAAEDALRKYLGNSTPRG